MTSTNKLKAHVRSATEVLRLVRQAPELSEDYTLMSIQRSLYDAQSSSLEQMKKSVESALTKYAGVSIEKQEHDIRLYYVKNELLILLDDIRELEEEGNV